MARINPEGAISKGDVMRRIADLERQVAELHTVRRLESAAIGVGGLRFFGGGSAAFEGGGGISILDGGNIRQTGGSYRADDATGEKVFEVVSDPASIFLRQELIEDVATAVFAARVFADAIATLEATSSATYTDLATVGPSVTVDIGTSGRAIVMWGATISPSAAGTGGSVSFAVSGATTIAATNWAALLINEGTTGPQLGAAKVAFVDSLNPGSNTFTLKYQRLGVNANVSFFDRTIVVIGF